MQSVPTSLNYMPWLCAIQNNIKNLVTEWLTEQKNRQTDMWCGHLNSSSHSWIESRYFNSNFCSITLIFAHTLTSFLLLFHMHTYFPSIFPTRAALCIYFHPLRGTSALTLWKTSHDMASWVPGSHLNSCMRSNQSRRQSNQTGLPCRLPCPLYAWSHRHMKMEKGDFNFAEVMGQDEDIVGVIRECKMSWWKHREYESGAKKMYYIMKTDAGVQFGISLHGLG